MRVDEFLKFEKLVLIDDTTLKGDFRLERGVGDLGYTGEAFVVDDKRGIVIPLRAVKIMFVRGKK